MPLSGVGAADGADGFGLIKQATDGIVGLVAQLVTIFRQVACHDPAPELMTLSMRVLLGSLQNIPTKKRHSLERRILSEVENGDLKVSDASRLHGISEQTYFRWKKKYVVMEVNEATRFRELEEENAAGCRRSRSSEQEPLKKFPKLW